MSTGATGLALSVTLAVACWGASCGSGSAASGNPTSDIASAVCQRLAACSPISDIIEPYGDVDTCITRQRVFFSNLLTASGSGWTAAGLEACAAATGGLACSALLGHDLPAACHPPGTRPDGASCADGSQCRSGTCLINRALTPATGCGTCGAPLTAPQICSASTDCTWGSACFVPNGSCGALSPAGAPCVAPDNCERGLTCIQGRCASPVPAGRPCTFNDDCDYLRGYVCDAATCTAQPFASAGQACGVASGRTTFCAARGVCALDGICHAAASDGAPCSLSTGPNCMAPAQCIGGLCSVLGQSCR